MYNFNIGRYCNVQSSVHLMNSYYKIICLLLFTFLILLINSYIFLFILVLFTILLVLLSNVSFKLYIDNIKPISIFIIFMFIINTIFGVPIINSIIIILKLILMVVYSSILLFTTTNYEIIYGINELLKPLKRFKVNTALVSQSIALSINFIPTIFEQGEKIFKSQASRGLDFYDGNLKTKIRSITSVIFPMFMLSFKRADDIADFMEVRLYNVNQDFTNKHYDKCAFDIFILISHIALFVAYIFRSVI